MTAQSPRHLILAAALLATSSIVSAQAETWQLLLPNPTAAPANLGRDVILDPFTSSLAPGVFLATEKASWSDGPSVPSIFRITPADAAFSQINLEPVDGALSGASRLLYNPAAGSLGGLYAAGFSVTISGSKGRTTSLQTWKVRRSPLVGQGDDGTWVDDDSFNPTAVSKGKTTAYDARAYGITTNDLGNIYVCGRTLVNQSIHWVVRKKSETTWSTVLDLATGDGHSIPYAISFVPQRGNNPAPALFVVGLFDGRWTVLRSVDRGASWQEPLLARWPSDGSLASAWDVASDSQGNIYVVGVRGRDGANKGWVVRKSADGGTTWTTLLDKPSDVESFSWAARINIDANDNITVAGSIHTALNKPNWTVVRNSPGQAWFEGSPGNLPASWEMRVSPFGEDATFPSKGRGVVTDGSGNMFLIGDVSDWTDPSDGTLNPGTRIGLLRLSPLP